MAEVPLQAQTKKVPASGPVISCDKPSHTNPFLFLVLFRYVDKPVWTYSYAWMEWVCSRYFWYIGRLPEHCKEEKGVKQSNIKFCSLFLVLHCLFSDHSLWTCCSGILIGSILGLQIYKHLSSTLIQLNPLCLQEMHLHFTDTLKSVVLHLTGHCHLDGGSTNVSMAVLIQDCLYSSAVIIQSFLYAFHNSAHSDVYNLQHLSPG